MSKLEEIANAECKLEMTPMIDVTFLLMIFFLCTIKFKALEGKLLAYLPKDVGVNTGYAAVPKEKVEIRVQVARPGERRDPLDTSLPWSGDGRFEYVGRETKLFVGPREMSDLDELALRLRALHEADPERPATIAPYPGTVYGNIVPVLDRAIGAGFTDITFLGEIKR